MHFDLYDPPTYGGSPIQEAMEEQRFIFGQENPEAEWILTSWDVWVKNPYYNGPVGRHPEDDYYPEDDRGEQLPPPPAEIFVSPEILATCQEENEDDIPF